MTPKKKGGAERLPPRRSARESWAGVSLGRHLARVNTRASPLVGCAVCVCSRRLSRRCGAGARRLVESAAPGADRPPRRRCLIRQDRRACGVAVGCRPGERDHPDSLRAKSRRWGAVAGERDRLGGALQGGRRSVGIRRGCVRGWRDLKIAVAQKRCAAPSDGSRANCSRLRCACCGRISRPRSGSVAPGGRGSSGSAWAGGDGGLARLGRGASWIWRSAARAVTGCVQALDICHACEHIAEAGKRLHGEGTAAALAFFERGRDLLVAEGWPGACRLVGDAYAERDTLASRC
jgi:hypothetical protein